jgi:SAM-dependent methyltransferase
MFESAYEVEAKVEATHWWFVARRELFAQEIRREGIPATARILDVGTSTGTNLRMLRELGFSSVTGLDFMEQAIRYCEAKGLGTVRQGDVCAMPFADGSFDFVLATDIIEHVNDDVQALREIARVLAPSGRALITVPAFPSLWGLQDAVAMHQRRYRMNELLERMNASGLPATHEYYFNYLLFVPIWLARQIIRFLKIRLKSENQLNTRLVYRMLLAVFRFDVRTAPKIKPPFGVSALVMARK